MITGSKYNPEFDFYQGYLCVLRIIERYQLVKDSNDEDELQDSIHRMFTELVSMANSFSHMMHEVQPHIKGVRATREYSLTFDGKVNGYSIRQISNSRQDPLPHPVPKDSNVESP